MLKYSSFDIVFQEVPDEITLAINITGCPLHCSGCHSPWLWEDTGMPLDEPTLSQIIENYRGEITCVCFMGGDASPEKIGALSEHVRTRYPEIKTAWYSGRDTMPQEIPPQTFNYIKLGRYRATLGGLRSSKTNQRMYKITEDGKMTDITALFNPGFQPGLR